MFARVQPLFRRGDPGYALTLRYGFDQNFYQQKFKIGDPRNDKLEKYYELSEEKVSRVMRLEQRTSAQSANPEKERYAGAFMINNWAFGVSGCDQYDDHCLALVSGAQTLSLPANLLFNYTPREHHERLQEFLRATSLAQ